MKPRSIDPQILSEYLMRVAKQIAQAPNIVSSEYCDEKTKECIYTNYDPDTDTAYALYISRDISKIPAGELRYFYNTEDFEDIEEGSLFKLVGSELILMDKDRYFSVPVTEALGKVVQAPSIGKDEKAMNTLQDKG